MRTFPADHIATGWYQIGWTDDFPPGTAVPLHYFDQELVAFRTAAGAVSVLDAYCPHLGAHLGYGGTVEDDCIRCPFHGWAYDSDGRDVDIPYGRKELKANVAVRSWNTR